MTVNARVNNEIKVDIRAVHEIRLETYKNLPGEKSRFTKGNGWMQTKILEKNILYLILYIP